MIKPQLIIIIVCLCFLSGCNDDPAKSEIKSSTASDQSSSQKVNLQEKAPAAKEVFVISNGSRISLISSEDPDGRFTNFVGKFEVAGGELVTGGKNYISIDMASIQTTGGDLATAFKGPDFFDVEKYPISRFQLKNAVEAGENIFEITGVLDLHGISKSITFPATFAMTGRETLMDMSADIPINRADFNLSETVSPGPLVLKLKINALPGDPVDLVLGEVIESDPEPRGGSKGGSRRGGDKGGQTDWRNMSEEERAERRRQFTAEIDKNHDGILAKDEMSERMWSYLGRADKNGDNQISVVEREEHQAEREAERQLREITGEEGDRGSRYQGRGDRDGKSSRGKSE